MEEARQHPALNGEQRAFAVIYFAGPTALLVAIILQITGHDSAIYVGFSIFALCRVIVSGWIALRPTADLLVSRSKLQNAISGAAWLILGGLSFWLALVK